MVSRARSNASRYLVDTLKAWKNGFLEGLLKQFGHGYHNWCHQSFSCCFDRFQVFLWSKNLRVLRRIPEFRAVHKKSSELYKYIEFYQNKFTKNSSKKRALQTLSNEKSIQNGNSGGPMCEITHPMGVLLLRFLVQGSSLVAVLPVLLPTIWTLVVVIFWAELALATTAALAMSTLAAMPTMAAVPKLCVTQMILIL